MFRNVILGYEHISVLNVTEGDSISEERVRHNEELANWKEANISLVVVRLIHPSFSTGYSETTARTYTYV